MALTDKQRRFAEEYLVDLNGTQAAIRAGYSKKTAKFIASQLLHSEEVHQYLVQRREEIAKNTDITPEKVLRLWWEQANVDINEIVEYRRENCRHCWGIDHQYQWTEGQFKEAQERAAQQNGKSPECAGGFGFVQTRAPHPDCPECGGEGHGYLHIKDSRKLKGGARRLYNGVQIGKDGTKVLMLDRDKALENVARHLGMFVERKEITGKNGAPIQHQALPVDLSGLTDEELSALEAIRCKLAGTGGNPG